MPTSTKGCVATSCKDVFFVTHLIQGTLNKLILESAEIEGYKLLNCADLPYATCTFELLPAVPESVRVNFRFRGENRAMYVWFSCDSDCREIAPESLSLSLGRWGQSELLMESVLDALSCLGNVYIDGNDGDEVPFAQIGGEPMSFLRACAEGIVPSSAAELARWRRAWPGAIGEPASVSIERFLGFPVADVEELFEGNLPRSKVGPAFKWLLARQLQRNGYA